MRAALLAFAVLPLLVAGCSSPEAAPVQVPADEPAEPASMPDEVVAPAAGPSPDQPAEAAALEVVRLPFHKTVDGGKSAVAPEEEDARLEVDLTGVTALLLELSWDSAVYDLDAQLIVLDDCQEGGTPDEFVACMPQEMQDHWLGEGDDGNYWVRAGSLGAPDSPVRLPVGRDALDGYGCAAGCAAVARAIVKEAAIDVTGELVLTLARGGAIPEGYTALA